MCLQKHRDRASRAQRNLCWYCRRPMLPAELNLPESVTAEQLLARQDGGHNLKPNIVAAHRRKTFGLVQPAKAFIISFNEGRVASRATRFNRARGSEAKIIAKSP